jgi:hypothetical protein
MSSYLSPNAKEVACKLKVAGAGNKIGNAAAADSICSTFFWVVSKGRFYEFF